ncbi:dynamin family protein [Paenibacillus sp. DYY-L-2]|uniref:dynamin family protein n=1 Tax=Paenibacillus sp. DYY-L-2 TaxID=3447013 RepID=UPI003F5035BC
METITSKPGLALQEKLVRLEKWYAGQGDTAEEHKVRDLRKKSLSGKLTLSFCGHFSAGKSSLINALCGKPVLPSGPLPTTANIAALHNGAPKAVLTPAPVQGADGRITLKEPQAVSLDGMNEYCRDGEAFEKVEIWDRIPLLGEHGVLLDTPGVDSGESAHAAATNSALHLADIVFYVMDYNHVLAETNLAFARQLADWGKPLYLVVNQVDKHREEEVPFERYRLSVGQAFELWGIKAEGVFYTSLKEAEHPLNMLDDLKETIKALLRNPDELLEYSIDRSLQHGGEEFLKRCTAAEQDETAELLQLSGGEDSPETLRHDLLVLEHKLGAGKDTGERLRQEWIEELDTLIANAYLMTPALREAAAQYLESRQPGFKAGLFFQRSKREREQRQRADDFLAKLKEQVSAQLDWHVRDLLRSLGRSHELWDPAWESRMDQELPQAEEAWISGPVREGAVMSGEYTLHYTAEVAAGISGRYRRAAVALADGLLDSAAPRFAAAREELAAQREALLARLAAAERLQALRAAAALRSEQLQALLGAAPSLPPGILPEVRDVPGQPLLAQQRQQPPAARAAGAPDTAAGPGPRAALAPPAAGAGRQRITAAAEALDAAAAELAPYPAFASGVRELRARAARLRGGRFTAALFGAFSAGKSSFANALLGAKVLPVSPHPTTAAISRILAPEGGMEHGQALITFKSPETMREDLANSFEALQLGPWKERSWRSEVEKLRAVDVPPSGRAHYSFLKAAAAGWEQSSQKLGTRQQADLEQFASYVAEESIACFVEGVDLYYSCPLTEQGIVIVDTPGADSIHARHTGVTFQYMKNSDALIYVTYYNHAFSRADRQFLAHLGRVKGSFALDKMFFIVNAADLASTSEELASVVEHVAGGLKGAGIDQPQIHAVSSLAAQSAKADGDLQRFSESGFALFETKFFDFIGNELTHLALEAAGRELETVRQRAVEWGEALRESRENRAHKLALIQEDRVRFTELLHNLAACDRSPLILQEAEELLFHVRNRLKLLAGDLFQEFFHPSLLRDEGDLKRKFAASFHGWVSQLSLELERELQSTSLRLEKKCDAVLAAECTAWTQKLKEELRSVPVFSSDVASLTWETPEVGEGKLEHLLQTRDYSGYFKSPKAFFEDGGKQKLREALEQPLADALKQAVDDAGRGLGEYYCSEAHRRFAAIADRFKAEWDEWESGMAGLGDAPENEANWEEILLRLTASGSRIAQLL